MKSPKLSLAGLIESNWIKSGRPRLTWDDLLNSAVAADTELQKVGVNPAKKFRRLRLAQNSSGMLDYVAGYHQYDFCPSSRDFHSDHPPQRKLSAVFILKSSDIVKLYHKLYAEHPHDLLPLETSLPKELKFDCRDQYRIILTMILSQRMGDLQLINCLVKLFSSYPDFESLKLLSQTQVRGVLSNTGFGFNDPRKQGNGARLWSLKEQYFGPWGRKVTQPLLQELTFRRARGFGLKFVRALQSYCFGNKEAFPLDGPAFRCLQEAGLYKDSRLDEARHDIEATLRDQDEVHMIDFHELLRFRGQAGIVGTRSLTQRQESVVRGWNGWRILCSNYRKNFNQEWIYGRLVKNQEIATRLLTFTV